VLVNNKAFTPALNDDLVRMFLDPEGYVSWTNAGGDYYIATRK